ncbi:MAG: glycosyltransferase family 2 protein [Candidatus Methylacidiphilales bacterium]
MSDRPKVSVLMAVYNGLPYLQQALDCTLNQTFKDFEFIIVNDASSDGTREVLEEYASRDPRIRLLHNEANLRQTASLNRGLAACRGEYLARIDADDLCPLHKLERQVGVMEAHPSVIMSGTNHTMIDPEGKLIMHCTRPFTNEGMKWALFSICPVGGNGMVRMDAMREAGGYNEDVKLPQDWDLCSRLFPKGLVIGIPEELYYVRIHPGQSTVQGIERSRIEADGIVQRATQSMFPKGSDQLRLTAARRRDMTAWQRWCRVRALYTLFKMNDPACDENDEFMNLVSTDRTNALTEIRKKYGKTVARLLGRTWKI